MGAIRRSVSIAASAIVDDQLVADAVREQLRRATIDGILSLYATQSATGLRLDVITGDTVDGSNLEPVVNAAAPLAPDHLIGQFAIVRGELVSLPVRNATAGALTLNYWLDVP